MPESPPTAVPPPSRPAQRAPRTGALNALAAYTLWGLFPLYWKALEGIPLVETLAHRVLWSLATILLILAFTGGLPAFRRALSDPGRARMLGLSALLIGFNWSMYIYAVYSGQVIQASLGYYINPLMSVGLGIAVLRERLSRPQLAAVVLAGLGVVLMAWEHRGPPWVALALAVSFALYSLVKKRLDVPALPGLAIETLWLSPIALGALLLTWRQAPQAFTSGIRPAAFLVGTGLVTLAPLFFFNGAARRLRLSTLGFFQYLSPSIQLVLAVILFHEPFTALHWAAFGFIWAALSVYSWDSLRAMRRG